MQQDAPSSKIKAFDTHNNKYNQYPRAAKDQALQELSSEVIMNYMSGQQCGQDMILSLQQFFQKNRSNDFLPQQPQIPQGQGRVAGSQGSSELSLEVMLREHVERRQINSTKLKIKHYVARVSDQGLQSGGSTASANEHTSSKLDLMHEQLSGLNHGVPCGWSKHKDSQSVPKYYRHLKSCFGHALHSQHSQDPEDPYIQVYNLIYDRTGQLIITGDDMGLIKIWSASNGLLLNSLKGHTMAINAIEINHTNEYLASCSNDGFVMVWDIASGQPITALKEDLDDPILVLLFFRGKVDELLIAASEKGNAYIYKMQDVVKCQGGILGTQFNDHIQQSSITHRCKIAKLFVKTRPHFIKDRIVETLNGILSIDMHPKGYLAVGTEQGDVIVYDMVDRAYKEGTLTYIVWKEHTNNCHMLKWNKHGTRILTASFDGTAKIWEWSTQLLNNKDKRSAVTLHFKDRDHTGRLTGELKCWAVTWSCQGTYAVAAFCRRLKRRGDQEKNFPQLQIYDCVKNEIINVIDAQNLNGILKMDTPHCLLDAHPLEERIVMSADNDGQIVVWDILTTQILKVFYERGFHMRLPNLEMQVLEGAWAPDGQSFSVSTAFGSFSIYGFGFKEFYNQTPVEQFYASDSEHAIIEDSNGFKVLALDHEQEFYTLERGQICNFYRIPYTYALPATFKQLYQAGFYRNACRGNKTARNNSHNHWVCSTSVELENHCNDLLFSANHKDLQEIEMSVYASQQQQLNGTLKQSELDELCQQLYVKLDEPQVENPLSQLCKKSKGRLHQNSSAVKVRDGEIEHEIYEPQQSEDEDEEECSIKLDDGQRLKRKRIIDDDEEELEMEFFANGSPGRKVQTRAGQKIQQKQQQSQSRNQRAESYSASNFQYSPQFEDKVSSSVEEPSRDRSSYPRTRQRAMANQLQSQEQRLSRITMHRQQQVLQAQQTPPPPPPQDTRKQRRQIQHQDPCRRCKQPLSNDYVACSTCRSKFHELCSTTRLVVEDYGTNKKCLNCCGRQPKKLFPKLASISRDYLLNEDTNQNLPQVGDEMIFFTQGYEQFLLKNSHQLDFSKLPTVNSKMIIFPADHDSVGPSLAGQVQCRVTDISYEWPCTGGRKIEAQKLSIQMLLTLVFDGGQFACFYNASLEYIVPLEQYIKSQSLKLYPNVLLKFYLDDEQYMFLGMDVGDPHLQINDWQNLKCRGFQDDQYALRGSKTHQIYNKFNQWEIRSVAGKLTDFNRRTFDKFLPFSVGQRLTPLILSKLNRKELCKLFFAEPVDVDKYEDYYDLVVVGCDVGTIVKRLARFYYRSEEHIIHDLKIIRDNAYRYNPVNSQVRVLADSLCESLIALVQDQLEREEDHKPLKKTQTSDSLSQNLSPQIQNKKYKLCVYFELMEEEEDDDMNGYHEIQTRGMLKRSSKE